MNPEPVENSVLHSLSYPRVLLLLCIVKMLCYTVGCISVVAKQSLRSLGGER